MQRAHGRESVLRCVRIELTDHADELRRDHDRVVVGTSAEFCERLETAQPLGSRIRIDLRGGLERIGNLDLQVGARDFRFAFALSASLHGHSLFDAGVLDGELEDFDRDDGHAPVLHLGLQCCDDGRAELDALVQNGVQVAPCSNLRDGRNRTRFDGVIALIDVDEELLHFLGIEVCGDSERQSERNVVLGQELIDQNRANFIVRQDGVVDRVEDRVDPHKAGPCRANVLAEQEDGNPLPFVDDVDAADEIDHDAGAERLRHADELRDDRPALDVREAEEMGGEFSDDEYGNDEWGHGWNTLLHKWP